MFTITLVSLRSNFCIQRKTLARKLNEPRILEIGPRTLGHRKATDEYHKTHDIIHVQQLLSHCDIRSTMIYINLERTLYNASNDEFYVKTVRSLEEETKLIEVGFAIRTVHRQVPGAIYRKRK